MLSGIVAWLVGWIRSRGRQEKRGNRARWAAGAAAALNLFFVIVFLASNPMEVIYGYPLILRLGMLLPLISIIPAVAGLVYAGLAWRDGYWGVAGRVHYTLVILAAVVFVWQLSYWHLLGWRLQAGLRRALSRAQAAPGRRADNQGRAMVRALGLSD